ncbi:hypothetical protein Y1Q_0011211 [Alligator mississippiensis]|uniref:Uncharacterized protein n=1 Tax=Alligator mississippiensis TaxID=8496 RepID=A0A151P8K7_ALLMI|nr:hypothetical protein Y1Q_0011211 [Alligator mississippiensis]
MAGASDRQGDVSVISVKEHRRAFEEQVGFADAVVPRRCRVRFPSSRRRSWLLLRLNDLPSGAGRRPALSAISTRDCWWKEDVGLGRCLQDLPDPAWTPALPPAPSLVSDRVFPESSRAARRRVPSFQRGPVPGQA